MRVFSILAAVVVISAAGCATKPTFQQLVYDTAQLNDSVVKGADRAATSHAITADQFARVLRVTDAVQASLVLANDAYAAGNLATANATIGAVGATLAAVQACLAGPSANLTQCLAGVATP